jgi:DNA-binding NarL/FixJ family response regulator
VTIRVVIADDHPVFRDGLAGVLAECDEIEVVGQAATGDEVVTMARERAPDVVLMDLHMPGTNGIEATRLLRQQAAGLRILVVTMHEDDETVLAAMRAGAHGYLVKGAGGAQIVAAVRAVADGQAVFGTDVADRVLGVLAATGRGTREGRAFPALTDRELEVLDLIAAGLPNGAIARRLVLSDKTVRNHVSNIFMKLQVPDRARAIVLARQAGLGEPPSSGPAATRPRT